MLTSLVGSYPQPDWLLDREKLRGRPPAPGTRVATSGGSTRVPRGRAGRGHARRDPRSGARRAGHHHRRRDPARVLLQLLRDGARGRRRRQPRLDARPQRQPVPAPRIVGPVRAASRSWCATSSSCARTPTSDQGHVPGPFTMALQAQDDHYGDPRAVAFAFADAVREEVLDLFAAGADIVQLDEPWMESRAEQAREFGIETLAARAGRRQRHDRLHICFGYPLFVPGHARAVPLPGRAGGRARGPDLDRDRAGPARRRGPEPARRQTIILGVIALDSDEVESAETVAERIRRALPYTPGPDRGPRLRDEVPHARGRVRQARSLVEGARTVSAELARSTEEWPGVMSPHS